MKKIKALFERCDVVCTEIKKADFLSNTFKQDMKRLLDSDQIINCMQYALLYLLLGKLTLCIAEFDLKLAMACSTCLMKYLALLSDPSNIGKYSLDIYDLAQYMRLDASAVKALNIMPSAQDGK